MEQSTPLTDNKQVENSQSGLWQILIAGAFGAFLAALIDNITNQSASITAKFLSAYFSNYNGDLTQILVAVGVGLTGAILCWIYKPVSRIDAFTKGLTIFAVLNIATGYEGGSSSNQSKHNGTQQQDSSGVYMQYQNNKASILPIGLFYFSPPQNSKNNFKPNAKILKFSDKDWISSTKPYTTLASVFNEKVYYKEIPGAKLEKNQRVEITGFYSTTFRHYTYVKIKYRDKNNQVKTGWIKAGKGSAWWYVLPDNPHDKMFR